MMRYLCAGTCLALMLSACQHTDRQVTATATAHDNWLTVGGDSDETHFSPLSSIDAGNIDRLGLAWSLDLPKETALAGSPLAIDGVLFFSGDMSTVYAVEAVSGRLLWKFDPAVWQYNPDAIVRSFKVTHGVAYADGRLFTVGIDGRLFAVDARTGRELWHVDTFIHDGANRYVHGAPRVFNGKVIIGNAGADEGARGYVTAYDTATGRQAWRFFVVPGTPDENRGDPAMERAAETWGPGEFWKTGTGGGPWDSIVFDRELNRIYLATGNPVGLPPDAPGRAGRDNLYTSSIVALDADSGKYLWHYQVQPGDAWDYDATEQITLATLSIQGQPRKVLMQAPKNGFFYVIDRQSGQLLSAARFGKVSWADRIDLTTGRPVESPQIRQPNADLWPSANGAHSWQAMSYSPKTGLVYIPTMQLGVHFNQPGGMGDRMVIADGRDGKGGLVAWDPLHQRQAWYVQHETFFNGGTLATAGNLVFQGTADGYLTAYDALSGAQRWRFYAGMGIISAPVSFSIGGRQYLSVLTGYGASAGAASLTRVGWRYAMPRRLLTFALDEHGPLPQLAQPDLSVHAVDDAMRQLDPTQVAAGMKLYDVRCRLCHGGGVASPGSAPDLRESQLASSADGIWVVAHDGALLQNGMPRFDDLSRPEVEQIFAYIRSAARSAVADNQAASRP
jgi:quinohemoprotein ethanol dehydrogenase